MENEDKKQTQKIDWKKKGLGWIPDYPDLRDYTLTHEDIQKDGRLKIKGDTDKIENISETIIKIINILAGANSIELRNQINAIETQIFGNISFVEVRFYRLLRKPVNPESSSSSSFEYPAQSELSKQVIALKKYLSILVLKGYLKYSQEVARKLAEKLSCQGKINLKIIPKNDEENLFENPAQLFQWLKEPEFDEITEFLVMLFQYGSGMTDNKIDGIVGLETYTTLNEYFFDSDKQNLKRLKNRIKKLEQGWTQTTNQEQQSFSQKTRLVYVPSLIPETIFNLILNELQSRVVKQVLNEYNQLKTKETISEINFLKNIGFDENESRTFLTLIDKIDKSYSGYFDNGFDETTSRNFFTALIEKYQLSKNFKKIFANEFFVVEPIVSFVIKRMSPLARNRNQPIESVVTKALNESHELFRKAFLETSQSSSSIVTSLYEPGDAEEVKLVKEMFRKVAQSFVIGIKLVISDKQNGNEPQDPEIDSKLCFYFIVKKFLNQFLETVKQCDNLINDLLNDERPNIFDKQELFELELPSWSKTDSSLREDRVQKETTGSNKLEFFPTQELQIPVNNSLVESLKGRNQKLKPYLFLPSVVDLSYWASAVEDQGALNSCTAFAGIALLEYFTNRIRGQFTDLSPLFLYKAVRNLMSLTDDVGASVRETMKAMALFGVPPEEYWPYEEDKVDEEPPSFCYSYAQNFQALKYFRLDYPGMPTELLLSYVKAVLAAGFPCMFGFTVYTSAYENSNINMGYIPFPSKDKDRVVSGHAVVAMGYDDLRSIPRADGTDDSPGAFLIRNSWGTEWGKEGYGWIPYDYVLQGLTRDWWSLLKSEWFDQESDGLRARSTGGEDHTSQKGGSG